MWPRWGGAMTWLVSGADASHGVGPATAPWGEACCWIRCEPGAGGDGCGIGCEGPGSWHEADLGHLRPDAATFQKTDGRRVFFRSRDRAGPGQPSRPPANQPGPPRSAISTRGPRPRHMTASEPIGHSGHDCWLRGPAGARLRLGEARQGRVQPGARRAVRQARRLAHDVDRAASAITAPREHGGAVRRAGSIHCQRHPCTVVLSREVQAAGGGPDAGERGAGRLEGREKSARKLPSGGRRREGGPWALLEGRLEERSAPPAPGGPPRLPPGPPSPRRRRLAWRTPPSQTGQSPPADGSPGNGPQAD